MNKKNTDELINEVVRLVLEELHGQRRTIKFTGRLSTVDKGKIIIATKTVESSEIADILCITHLSISMLGRLVQLAPKDEVEEEIIDYLVKGKEVLLYKRESAKSNNRSLQLKIRDNYKQLLTFGVKEMDSLVREENGKDSKLYTEEKIKAIVKTSESAIYVEENAIFTALAKDYIREKKIIIKQVDRGGKL